MKQCFRSNKQSN